MDIQFLTRTVSCCRESFRQTKVIQENCDCIVSDVNEDIGQIVWADAQLCLKSKDITQHGVSISFSAEFSVLYLDEKREHLCSMSFSREFAEEFDLPSVEPDMKAQVLLSSLGAQARAVNSRKLSLQLTVRVDLSCWMDDTLSIATGMKEAEELAVQIKEESASFYLSNQVCEKSFVISEQLPLPAEDEAEGQLLLPVLGFGQHDCQIIGEKALIKSSAEISLVRLDRQSDMLQKIERTIPFTVLLDIPDEDCSLEQLLLQPTGAYVNLSDAINGSRMIELELHILAQAAFARQETLTYIEDAYSTRYPLIAQTECLRLRSGRDQETLNAQAEEKLLLEGSIKQIVSVFASLISCSSKEEKACASVLTTVLLQSEDQSYSAVQKLLSIESQLPEGFFELSTAALSHIEADLDANTLQINAAVVFSLVSEQSRELLSLSSAEADLDNPFDLSKLPSLTAVKRRNRTLWSIAKAYHSCVSAIEELQERYPMPNDILLIPRV